MQVVFIVALIAFAVTLIHFIYKMARGKAYKAGYACGIADGDLMANPYLVGTKKRGDWMHGWRNGKSEFIMNNSESRN